MQQFINPDFFKLFKRGSFINGSSIISTKHTSIVKKKTGFIYIPQHTKHKHCWRVNVISSAFDFTANNQTTWLENFVSPFQIASM